MNKPTLGALLAASLFVPGAYAGELSDCTTVAACNQQGTAAYKAKNYDVAIGHFENQIDFAERAEDVKAQLMAFNNLALAHLKKGEPLRAKAWLEQAADTDPNDKATLFNRGEVDKALAGKPARPAIGGSYISYIGGGQWSTIELKEKGKNLYQLNLLALRLGNAWREWGPAGIGELEADLKVEGNKATYEEKFEYADEACKIEFKFVAPDEIEVEQWTPDMSCGFGNAVAATGYYYRVEAAASP
jgi:tetratricopeptide (TPR) repeat protein